jgi:hypothetical protein
MRRAWRAWSAATSLLAAPLTAQKSVVPKTERTRINMHQDYEVRMSAWQSRTHPAGTKRRLGRIGA